MNTEAKAARSRANIFSRSMNEIPSWSSPPPNLIMAMMSAPPAMSLAHFHNWTLRELSWMNRLKTMKSQIASVIAYVFSNTAVTKNNISSSTMVVFNLRH
ncbi:hypothetical protein NE237_011501 [Protea cynaroides]|uniref:Uncharacterized protein n=1 Tax=Protea cynaroides TaxID=273540 RepID=A0A9Q0GVT0_9MAGN|nr:hypothetical protein NE237_011501 [Protea cynaroides]